MCFSRDGLCPAYPYKCCWKPLSVSRMVVTFPSTTTASAMARFRLGPCRPQRLVLTHTSSSTLLWSQRPGCHKYFWYRVRVLLVRLDLPECQYLKSCSVSQYRSARYPENAVTQRAAGYARRCGRGGLFSYHRRQRQLDQHSQRCRFAHLPNADPRVGQKASGTRCFTLLVVLLSLLTYLLILSN